MITPDEDPVTARIVGWGSGLREHDLLVIPHQAGGAGLYEIEDLRYAQDPGDMWFTTCRFVPGTSELGRWAAAAPKWVPLR